MATEAEFLDFAAQVLKVPRATLSPDSAFGTVPEWDSIMHLRLATEAGERFGVRIPMEALVSLRTLGDFWAILGGGPVRKVLALDLDNTLWEGVVGEDGIDGISPRTDFQREIKALKDRGILLVALSKNNPEDVEPVWSDRRMVLKREDFVAMAIDWGCKADNLGRIAGELNLSADAFVFVDDNPVQREEMRAKRPEVAVPEFPPDLSRLFPARPLTAEDRDKTEQYRAEAERRRLAASVPHGEWLARLGIHTDVRRAATEDVPRLAQLSQKTNQFNVTDSRLTEGEVGALLADPRQVVLVLRAGDRYGEQGLVAFARATVDGTRAEIADFVMSCRVMDRGIEDALLAALERELAARGVTTVTAAFRPTGRNEPARTLFARLGYATAGANLFCRALS